ncbi:MAG: hypothetical protein V4735_01290 [Pseudomonadota bacterium]
MNDEINSNWNYAVCYLEFLFNDLVIAKGSGFFWEASSKQIFLISNWHNFSGRSNEDGQPLSKETGATPNSVSFYAYQQLSEPDENNQFALNITKTTVPLVHPTTGDNLWYEHPTFGRRVDLGALRASNIKNFNHIVKPANTLETDCGEKFCVSQDAFIVGYPLGLVTAAIPIPVWKRGTIATEPYINPDGNPFIYVDAATRKGMSGSVVVVKDTFFGQHLKKDGTKSANTIISKHEQILGIYSGRLHPNNVEAQLGKVWKRHLIDELVESPKIADTSLIAVSPS